MVEYHLNRQNQRETLTIYVKGYFHNFGKLTI